MGYDAYDDKNSNKRLAVFFIIAFLIHLILIWVLPGFGKAITLPVPKPPIKTKLIELKKFSLKTNVNNGENIKKKFEDKGKDIEGVERTIPKKPKVIDKIREALPELAMADTNINKSIKSEMITFTEMKELSGTKSDSDIFDTDVKNRKDFSVHYEKNGAEKIPLKVSTLKVGTDLSVGNGIEKGITSTGTNAPDGIAKIEIVGGEGEAMWLDGNMPEYPEIAKKRGWEGLVNLILTIDENSRVVDVTVNEKSGYNILDEVALKEAYNWKISLKNHGVRISGKVSISINFVLKN